MERSAVLFRRARRKIGPALPGAFMLAVVIAAALLAPWIAPHDPLKISMDQALQRPSAAHLCGTDEFGRDVFSRILFGARISLIISLWVLVSIGISGAGLGMVAGYYKRADRVVMGVMDGLMAFPSVILALVILTVMGSGLPNMVLALSLAQLPRVVRTVRAAVISSKGQEYVEAARSMGASDGRIMFKYILPMCLPPLIIRLTLTMALTILNEATLTFLGVGLPPGTPSWGTILSEARQHMSTSPYLILLPGGAVVWSVMALNLLGDGLRDVLDPRLN